MVKEKITCRRPDSVDLASAVRIGKEKALREIKVPTLDELGESLNRLMSTEHPDFSIVFKGWAYKGVCVGGEYRSIIATYGDLRIANVDGRSSVRPKLDQDNNNTIHFSTEQNPEVYKIHDDLKLDYLGLRTSVQDIEIRFRIPEIA